MKMKKFATSVAGAALALAILSGCVTAEEISNNATMGACDGFSTRIRETPSSKGGVEMCTQALAALDESRPDDWYRRVSLLQSRALHHIANKQPKEALADLDAADAAAVVKDVYYERSLGLNNKLIRALALYKDDRAEEARPIAMAAAASRPYSRDTALAALSIVAIGGDKESIDQLAVMAGRAHPNLSTMAFLEFFETKRYEQALAIADQVRRPTIPESQTYDMRTQILRQERKRKDDVVFWCEIDGYKAYALAALGRADEALAMIDASAARIPASKVVPTPLPLKRPSDEDRARNVSQEQVNREIDLAAIPMVKFWDRMVRARIALNAGDKEKAIGLTKDIKLESPTLAFFDFSASENAQKLLAESDELRVISIGLPPPSAELMFSFLQNVETRDAVAQAIDPVTGMFMSQDDRERGGCSEGPLKNGLEGVCYMTLKSSPNVAEERAILRAADKALERGAAAFAIENRLDTRHITVSTNYGVELGRYESGYESQLEVRFFKPGDAAGQCFRCLNPKDVVANLAPIYRPPAAAKP